MNFDKLFTWIVSIVIGFAAVGKIDTLQRLIWTAQAKVVSESKTSSWGSPRFFPNRPFSNNYQVKNQKFKQPTEEVPYEK